MHAKLLLACPFVLAAACGERDCASMTASDERDWCFHERAIDHAADGRLPDALDAVQAIQAPMVKAFATEKILTTATTGISQQQAEAMCRNLLEPYSSSCLRAWSRPHLWSGS